MTSFSQEFAHVPMQVVVRGRDSLMSFLCPESPGENQLLLSSQEIFKNINFRLAPQYTPNGELLSAIMEGGNILLLNSATGNVEAELPVGDVEKLEFSALGNYVTTWSRPVKTSEESFDGNLRVFHSRSGALVASYSQKVYKQDLIQWTKDEAFCFRMVSNEVQIYSGDNISNGSICKIHHKGFSQYKISPVCGQKIFVAVFNPAAGGNPAKVTLFSYNISNNTVDGPISTRTIFAASEAKLLWNATGKTLLIHSHSDVDSSNSSYYGATGLFMMRSEVDVSCKVEQSKAGPIHDVQWSPLGDRFVVAAGTMPCHTTMYDEKADPVYQFGAAHRNTICWAPHGRFLCIAGFGNLAGEMDFYDALRLRKMGKSLAALLIDYRIAGSNVSHCATTCGWSPDSRLFYTASLAPRMNVDNNFKLFKYSGYGPVYTHPLERAYDVLFQPAAPGKYPNRSPSPRKESAEGEPVAAKKPEVAKVEAYRAPGSSSGFADFMANRNNRDPAASVAVGKVKKEPAPAPAKYVPPAQKQRVIPGMAPPMAAPKQKAPPAAAAAKAAPSSSKAPSHEAAVTKPKAAATPPAPVAAPGAPAESEADTEKRIKALRKKLKQLDELKAKRASGQALDADQMKKLESEASLQEELNSLL